MYFVEFWPNSINRSPKGPFGSTINRTFLFVHSRFEMLAGHVCQWPVASSQMYVLLYSMLYVIFANCIKYCYGLHKHGHKAVKIFIIFSYSRCQINNYYCQPFVDRCQEIERGSLRGLWGAFPTCKQAAEA